MKTTTRRNPFQKLGEKRKQIDLIDQKLLALLNQRLRMAQEVGHIKKAMRKKIRDPKREKEVIERLKIRNRGPLREKDLEKIFRTIMGVCRRVQKVVNSEVPL